MKTRLERTLMGHDISAYVCAFNCIAIASVNAKFVDIIVAKSPIKNNIEITKSFLSN